MAINSKAEDQFPAATILLLVYNVKNCFKKIHIFRKSLAREIQVLTSTTTSVYIVTTNAAAILVLSI
jgi:uncharacterized integral membrane protein